MLPDIDGYQIIKAVKENNKNTPVIFMSARNEELDRVVGLELGSDDYLSKPFLPRELIIRTNKLMERIYGKSNNSMDIITNIGEYKISRKQRTVFSEKKKFN
ncbi:DNA-binding response regulator [Clostridium botulinum A1 str. CFSAN002368]|nr:DNA-binding response regulator [Clostridium botulinum A1 str. CFSAN002368]